MPSRRSAAVLVLAMFLAGCGNKAAQDAAAVADGTSQASEIRERYQRLNGKNQVGVVSAILEKDRLAAVSDVMLANFAMGDVMTFINGREEPFNTGVVVNATADALHLKYESRKRAPRVGDLAVRLAQQ